MTTLNTIDSLKIFKYYMKQYFIKPDKEVYHAFQELIENSNNTCYCQGTRYGLLQCGLAYLDYKKTYMNHTQIFSYDILNAFLHLDDDQYSQVFYEYPSYPLVIYHPRGTTDNGRLMSLITHLYSYRHLMNYKTLILSERPIKTLISDKITPITDLSSVCKLIDNDIDYEETGEYDI